MLLKQMAQLANLLIFMDILFFKKAHDINSVLFCLSYLVMQCLVLQSQSSCTSSSASNKQKLTRLENNDCLVARQKTEILVSYA